MRLGLILSDIGSKNEIKVENEELHQAVLREAMRFPGQERKVFEFFKNNQAALEQLRAPFFEDKVCDFIFTQAQVDRRAGLGRGADEGPGRGGGGGRPRPPPAAAASPSA